MASVKGGSATRERATDGEVVRDRLPVTCYPPAVVRHLRIVNIAH